MPVIKCFVTPDNSAMIICPNCKTSRTLPAGGYRDKKHFIKVRCTCAQQFEVLLDFRRHYRKKTDLRGTYILLPPSAGKGDLHIHNLSRSGVGFTVHPSVDATRIFIPGRKMRILFQLDNRKRTSIEKMLVIRNVEDHAIGGEFDSSEGFDKDLGFYLQP